MWQNLTWRDKQLNVTKSSPTAFWRCFDAVLAKNLKLFLFEIWMTLYKDMYGSILGPIYNFHVTHAEGQITFQNRVRDFCDFEITWFFSVIFCDFSDF